MIKNNPDEYITVGMIQDRNRKEWLARTRSEGSKMSKFDPIDYAIQYGSGCRDCADARVRGVCDLNGTPCNTEMFRAAVKHAMKAWTYGIEHGYMDNPFSALTAPQLHQHGGGPQVYTNEASNYNLPSEVIVSDSLFTALAQQPLSVPEGWQLVPIEPTDEMYQAGWDKTCAIGAAGGASIIPAYKAMLAASSNNLG